MSDAHKTSLMPQVGAGDRLKRLKVHVDREIERAAAVVDRIEAVSGERVDEKSVPRGVPWWVRWQQETGNPVPDQLRNRRGKVSAQAFQQRERLVMPEVGDRVGVILGAAANAGGKGGTVKLLGFGVYEADEIPPDDVMGFNIGMNNPKLVLDDGQVCWGCETWWGSEKAVKKRLAQWQEDGYDVVNVNMVEEREKARIINEGDPAPSEQN